MASRRNVGRNSSDKRCASTVDDRIASLAGRQKGRIATRQLQALGLTRDDILYRVRVGRLHRLERGVYAVGHLASIPDAPLMTKVLRAGPDAVVSHRTAGRQHGVWRRGGPRFELTVPRRRRPIPGVTLHVARLPDDERTVVDSIPVTTLPRTLFDLAGQLTEGQLEGAIGEAEAVGFTDALSLPDLLERYPRRRGVARLRCVLARLGGGGIVLRSELERRFYALIADRCLPRPATNVVIEASGERYECDCVWRSRGLVVELDGRRWHERRRTAAADRIRDRRLTVAGWTVVRITWEQLRDDAAALMDDLESLIYTHQPRRRSSAGRALHS